MLIALGRAGESCSDLRDAASVASPVQQRARAQLKKLNLPEAVRETGTHEPIASTAYSAAPPAPAYAGSKACKNCHQAEFEAGSEREWRRCCNPTARKMSLTILATNGSSLGCKSDPVAYMKVEKGRHIFQIRAEDGAWHRYPVDYTIGFKWQQAYTTVLPDGRIQVFPIQYDVIKHEWINYWQSIDHAGSERADVRAFHRMADGTNSQRNCAPCHTSQLRAGTNNDVTRSSFLEGGINCEMCTVRRENRSAELPINGPWTRRWTSGTSATATRCRSALHATCGPQYGFPMPRFPANFLRNIPNAPIRSLCEKRSMLRKAFYKDGRFRETTFIVEAFMRSGCLRKGGAQGGHCHNPHLSGQGEDHSSLKFAANPDEICLQCQTKYRVDVECHTHRRASSHGSRCEACHMPRIMNSLLFKARSHQIDDLSIAEEALRFREAEIPNTCLECHSSKDVLWVQAQLKLWKPIPAVETSHAMR